MSQVSDPVAIAMLPFSVQVNPSPVNEQLLYVHVLAVLVTHALLTETAALRPELAADSEPGNGRLASAASRRRHGHHRRAGQIGPEPVGEERGLLGIRGLAIHAGRSAEPALTLVLATLVWSLDSVALGAP